MPSREPLPDLFSVAPLPVAPLDDEQRLACLRLIRSENVGPASFRALINHYGGAREALAALPEIGRRSGLRRALKICSADVAAAEIEAAQAAQVRLLFTIEPGFPAPLAFVEGAPPLLYVKGRADLFSRPTVAVVGSRQASAAGCEMARAFAAGLGQGGAVVASGLARGIDGVAHQAALATGTVAVVAGGVDVVYPPEHEALHAAIAEHGCIVSEMPLGYRPRAQDFPRRNRVISGLSRAVVIIEAARRSGSLITARVANEQGRDVFAVPGHPLDPRAEGTNQLIKDGATLVTTPEEVLAALAEQAERGPEFKAPAREEIAADRPVGAVPPSSAAEFERPEPSRAGPQPAQMSSEAALAEVARVIGPAPVALDAIVRATGLPAREVRAALTELSLAGVVETHGGQLVSRKAPS